MLVCYKKFIYLYYTKLLLLNHIYFCYTIVTAYYYSASDANEFNKVPTCKQIKLEILIFTNNSKGLLITTCIRYNENNYVNKFIKFAAIKVQSLV